MVVIIAHWSRPFILLAKMGETSRQRKCEHLAADSNSYAWVRNQSQFILAIIWSMIFVGTKFHESNQNPSFLNNFGSLNLEPPFFINMHHLWIERWVLVHVLAIVERYLGVQGNWLLPVLAVWSDSNGLYSCYPTWLLCVTCRNSISRLTSAVAAKVAISIRTASLLEVHVVHCSTTTCTWSVETSTHCIIHTCSTAYTVPTLFRPGIQSSVVLMSTDDFNLVIKAKKINFPGKLPAIQ